MSLSTYHSPFLPASHFSFFLETCILFGITSFPSCFDKQNVATLTEGPVWWGGQVPETSPSESAAAELVQASECNPIFWYTSADSGELRILRAADLAQYLIHQKQSFTWCLILEQKSFTGVKQKSFTGVKPLSDASSVNTGTLWWEGG